MDSPIYAEQAEQEEQAEQARRILHRSRSELYLGMRYLDLALGSLPLVPGEASPAGTDGGVLYYRPEAILTLRNEGQEQVAHTYLHTILHCLFAHPFDGGRHEARLWDLACDTAVEALIDSLNLKAVHLPRHAFARSVWARLRDELPVLTAETICREMESGKFSERELARWQREFTRDDHRLWQRKPEGKAPQQNPKRWEEIRKRMETEIELFSKEAADREGDLREALRIQNRSRYDYREFLRRFTMLREVQQVDPDSFDYIFYHYGLSLYGNMPLIEPQETREVRRLEELVIVIDTSMSCRQELVEHFLEETAGILCESHLFSRMRVHLLQCDEAVQEDVLIQSPEAFAAYLAQFVLKGGGGTDFRPAFAYVDEQLAAKRYGQVRGLIYFTDGYGAFPVRMPVYDTAFIFLRQDYRDADVPPWAIKLILGEEELHENTNLQEKQQ